LTELKRGRESSVRKTEERYLETVRGIAAEIAGPAADSVDREGRFPHEAVAALKTAHLMSAFVPKNLGGLGCGMVELAGMCEALAEHCASAAMVFAMHQIQVACIVRHGLSQAFFQHMSRVGRAPERHRVGDVGGWRRRRDAHEPLRRREDRRRFHAR
jgi:alkylation response protein AidB-like acyl-CoA dehydrogenase